MYNKRNSNQLLKDDRFSPAQRIVVREIIQLSDRIEGCTAKNPTLAKDLSIGISTIKTAIRIANELDMIFVYSDGKNRKIELTNPTWKQPKSDHIKEGSSRNSTTMQPENNHLVAEIQPHSSQNLTTKQPDFDLDVVKNQPPIYGGIRTEKEHKEERERDSTKNSFSVLNTSHDELVKYLLKKHRRKLVELLPKGTAEEIAAEFANYWVGLGRDFTNTKSQRTWVDNSLPKWAEIEKPKNETSEIKTIVKQIWKKDLNDKELQFVTKKISTGVSEKDLIDVLVYAKQNIMSENNKNPYFVFGDNFQKYLEYAKEAAA